MDVGDVKRWVGGGAYVGVMIMWQSPIYSLMRKMGTLANVKIKGNACA